LPLPCDSKAELPVIWSLTSVKLASQVMKIVFVALSYDTQDGAAFGVQKVAKDVPTKA
jgi:hypothetical protein